MYNIKMTDTIDDATKKVKNAEQDARAKAQTTEDHAEGKPSSETLNKAKENRRTEHSFCCIFDNLITILVFFY